VSGTTGDDSPRLEALASDQPEKHPLVASMRQLLEAVTLLDSEQSSSEELIGLTREVERLLARVHAAPSLRRFGGAASAPPGHSALSERSPVSGLANPLAPPLHLTVEADQVRGRAIFGHAYEGPPGVVHGGYVTAAHDELLGVAQRLTGKAGPTGILTVRLLHPTPLNVPIDYESEVDRVEGRKIFMRGRSFSGGELVSESEGLFIARRQASHSASRRPRSSDAMTGGLDE